MSNESIVESKKESTAEKDDKAEKAGKEVTKDIEYDDKKDKKDKKKSLKDWFEAIDKNLLNEADLPLPILGKDGKAVSAQPGFLKMQGTDPTSKAMGDLLKDLVAQKKLSVVAPIEQPKPGQAPAQQPKPGVTPTTPTTTSTTPMQEEEVMEKAPPGMEDVVLSLKKKYPGEEGRAYAIAWSMYNKKHGKNEAAEDNPESAMLDEKWAGDAKVKPTGEYSGKTVEELKSMLAKLKKTGPHEEGTPGFKRMRQIMFAIRAKKGWKGGVEEAEIPHAGPDYGAGLGAGRNPNVLETKQVNESMNTLEAAYHEGKSHGLSKHSYACRYNEGSEEHKRYHDGFKEGLDECYGLMPNRGLVVGEMQSGQDVVDDMASYGAEEGQLGEMDKTAYMKQQAMKTPGDTFKAFGQTMHDKDVLEGDFAFESLDKQLNALLNEDAVSEGISVSMSTGNENAPDTVSVTATDEESAKLLDFIKQVGLGGMGAGPAEPTAVHGEPVVAISSDYGAPKFGGYDSGMMDLIKKVSVDDHEEDHDHMHGESTCNECGMMEADCGCDESQVVDEVETPDQMTDEMAEAEIKEDDGEGDIAAYGQEAEINSSMPAKGGATNEDTGSEATSGAADAVQAGDDTEEAEQAMSESSFFNLYKKLAVLSEESTAEKDDKAEKAAKKVAKDIEYDEGHKDKDDNKAEKAGEKVKKDIEYDDKKDKKEKKLDEWANEAGKDGTEQSFMRDIDFMTKVIAGGLNKPKSTGQTTIPVIAGQEERTGDADVQAWKKLAGLAK